MLKRMREMFGKLRNIPVKMRATRLYDARHISMEDALMIEESDEKLRLRTLCERMGVENVITAFPMPMGLAEHFTVNGRDVPAIPMVTEERTVIAAASKAAKICGPSGFHVEIDRMTVRGQLLLKLNGEPHKLRYDNIEEILREIKDDVLRELCAVNSTFASHGGGVIDYHPYAFHNRSVAAVALTVLIHPGDAMGARGVTSICKDLGKILDERSGAWTPVSWICLNDNPTRHVRVFAFWPGGKNLPLKKMKAVAMNSHWAHNDPRRAVTHNKGIMNAVDAVGLATGQDTRAIAAGVWADAYRGGHCRPLSNFWIEDGGVKGSLKMQLTVGTVGGATNHPFAEFSRRLMGTETSAELMSVMGAVALAQNFAALAWALDT